MSSTVARDTAVRPDRPASRFRPTRRTLIAACAAGAVIAGGAWYGYDWFSNGRFLESTDDAYIGGNVTALSAHVAALVEQVLVRDNQLVRAGQLLVRLDRRDYEAARDQAAAALDARRAALDSLNAQSRQQLATIQQQQAELEAKTAQAAFAEQDASRYRDLARIAAGTRQDAQRAASLDQQARSGVAASAASLDVAKQRLAVLGADIAQAKARIASAEADVRSATLNLGWTELRAPVDGYVGNRLAQVGAYATPGSYLLSVIPSAGLWVDANFKENQLARMAPGLGATVVADILPGHPFKAHVASVAPGTGGVFSVIPPENATGNFTKIVQRVPVRVELDADDKLLSALRPGLSTTVTVDTRATAP